MIVLVTGGTGLIGRALCTSLLAGGHKVRVLTRSISTARAKLGNTVELIQWGAGGQLPQHATAGIEAVVNLAGENIGTGRWTKARKERIEESRRETTRALVLGIAAAQQRPKVLVSASAVGYYGPRRDEEVTEEDGPGNDFLARVCQAWENEAARAEELGVRVVRLRFGIVLARDQGTLPRLVAPFKLFLGGPLGPGRQWVSWIHLEDALGIIHLALTEQALTGAVNATAPTPVRMKEFACVLGKVLKRPSWLPIPSWALRLALGEMANLLTTGQRVLPVRAMQAGYTFRYPTLIEALTDLLVDH